MIIPKELQRSGWIIFEKILPALSQAFLHLNGLFHAARTLGQPLPFGMMDAQRINNIAGHPIGMDIKPQLKTHGYIHLRIENGSLRTATNTPEAEQAAHLIKKFINWSFGEIYGSVPE